MDWDFKLPDPPFKVCRRMHVGECKIRENPKYYPSRQYMARSLYSIIQETERNTNCRIWQNVPHSKQHASTGIRVKLEQQQCCSCDAVHCEGRQSRETSDLCNFESKRACGKVKRQDMDHITEKWCVCEQSALFQEALNVPEAQSAVD